MFSYLFIYFTIKAISFKFNRAFLCVYSPAAGSGASRAGEQPSAAEHGRVCFAIMTAGGKHRWHGVIRRRSRAKERVALIGPEVDGRDVRERGE